MKIHANNQHGFMSIWVIVIIVLLAVGAGGGYWYYASQQNDQEESAQTEETAVNEDDDAAAEEDNTLAGFTLFSDIGTGIEFAYPESWGVATMQEEDFSHDGESYWFDFSANSDVFAGVKSPDFAYTGPPRGGFGAAGYGYSSFDEQFANIQQANQERLENSDAYSIVIASESDNHLIYAGFDAMSEGYYITLLLRESSGSYGAFEFTYYNDAQPDPEVETRNALGVISPQYIEELNSIVSINQTL